MNKNDLIKEINDWWNNLNSEEKDFKNFKVIGFNVFTHRLTQEQINEIFFFYNKKLILKKAIELVTPLAKTYHPKQDSTWFEYYDKEGYSKPFEQDQDTYCEDCIDDRELEIIKNENKRIKFPDDFESLIQSVETSKENEDFLHCDSCGKIIDCAIIWTDEELDHWTSLTNEDWKLLKNNSYYYYQILKILEDVCGPKEEFNEKCFLIAESVLKQLI